MRGLKIPLRPALPLERANRPAAATRLSGGGWHPSRCSAGRGKSQDGCRSISLFPPSPRPPPPLIIGLIVSATLGISIGVAMGLRKSVEWMAAPIFIVLQAAPVAAVIPMVTFVYGIGLTAKVISVCLLALPVIVLNSYKAVANVNPSLIHMCCSFLG